MSLKNDLGQMAEITPVEITRLTDSDSSTDAPGRGVRIRWSSGEESEIDSETLRRNCPCATCKEVRGEGSHSKPLGGGRALLNVVSATIDQEINLKELWPVGKYAIGMRWADSHDTGIYPYALLLQLGQSEE